MKDPKEKADFLVAQFCKHSRADDTISPKESAKKCALINVDQTIEALDVFNYTGTWYDDYYTGQMILTEDKDPSEYWKEVRKHIEKL